MRKLLICFLAVLMLVSSAFAQQGMHEPGTGLENPELREESMGTGQGLEQNESMDDLTPMLVQQQEQVEVRQRTRARNMTELGLMIQERQNVMNQEMQGFDKGRQGVYQNQNRIRLAVHSLLAMSDLTPGVGSRISDIAKDFNNSVQKTIQAEESIRPRSGFVRFFAGGDNEAAGNISEEVNKNTQRIQQMKQIRDQCECEEPVREMMQSQIREIEQENERLQGVAFREGKKGLLGWIWK